MSRADVRRGRPDHDRGPGRSREKSWTRVQLFVDAGMTRAPVSRMDPGSKARLAVRTIVVTTRVAVAVNLKAGRMDLAQASARRGLELLHEIHGETHQDGAGEAWDQAEQHLVALADAPKVAIRIEPEAEQPLPRTGRRSNGVASRAH